MWIGERGGSRPSLWLPKPPLNKESKLVKAAESAEAGDAEKASRIWATANHCVRERPRMMAPELIFLYHRCKSRCEENLPPSMNICS